jgi:hypothetical protein
MSACKLAWNTNKVEVAKAALLESYRSWDNDNARAQAIRYSKQYNVWVCVTYDGVLWEARAHMPDICKQAVIFINGKFDSVWEVQ